jgi:acetyltransferase-like isoleucine patch superfamily enzyme
MGASKSIIIAKTAVIEEGVMIGEGTQVMHGAYISKGTIIGKNCFIGYNTVIRPNVTIGDGTHIRSLCFVAEGAKIGKNCKIIQLSNLCKDIVLEDDVFFGTGVLTCDTKKISHRRKYKPFGQPPYIKRGSRIGSGVRIIPGVVIAECTMVDVASVVTKDTEPYGQYRGTPARKIKEISEEEKI